MTATDQFIYEHQEMGVNPHTAWDSLRDIVFDLLVNKAKKALHRSVTLPEAHVIAAGIVGEYGEDAITEMAMNALTLGLGRRVWDMHFYKEDGTEIPQEEGFAEIRKHATAPEGEPWEFGHNTILRWVLSPEETA